MSILKSIVDYAATAMPAEFGDLITVVGFGNNSGGIAAVGEIMRRINYNPDPRHLVETRARWRGVFSTPIADPKQAKTRYLNFANQMNADMADALMAALKRRAAGLPPIDWSTALATVYDPDTFENVTVETDEFKLEQERERAAAEAEVLTDQAMAGLIDRLLEATPIDDERWGRW
jgi:hypothetical protein